MKVSELFVTEDWGSSDWSAVIRMMDKAIEGGADIDSAASDAAISFYEHMGYDSAEDAEPSILRMYKTRKGIKESTLDEGSKGWWVLKNKDGKEKRFKNDQSPEAIAWKNSSTPKKTTVKLAAYSQAYWEKKEMEGAERLPWTKFRDDDLAYDEIEKIVKDHFGNIKYDWTFEQSGEKVRDGVHCAAQVIRVMFEVGPEDDMGLDHHVQDAQNIIVARNPKNPRKIDFLTYGY